MWGNGAVSATVNPGKAGVTLECSSCHDPHGNGNYRILKPIPNDSDAAVAVDIPDAVAKNYTTADYWLVTDRQVPTTKGSTVLPVAGQTDGYVANVAAWCTTCHTRYLAGSGSYKTASGDATFMYRHRSDANYKQGAANCITCHVSHGSNATMQGVSVGLLPGDTAAPAGDSHLLRVDNRGTCLMCHNV
jgi:cytochrome c553